MFIRANKKESFFLGIECSIIREHSFVLSEYSPEFLKIELFKENANEGEYCWKEVVRTPPNLPLSSARASSSNCSKNENESKRENESDELKNRNKIIMG